MANGFAKHKLFRSLSNAGNSAIRPSYDRIKLIERFIIPNAILEATLISVKTSDRNPSKMQSLKVQITGLRALAHSGKKLYQPYKNHAHLYEEGGYSERDPVRISAFREFSEEIQRHNVNETLFGSNDSQLGVGQSAQPLIGYIDESRHIYD